MIDYKEELIRFGKIKKKIPFTKNRTGKVIDVVFIG